MISGFDDYGCGTEGSLGGQQRGYIAWQSDFHASFSQRLQDDVNVRRPASGEPGDRVHMLFIDDYSTANYVEESTGGLHLLCTHVLTFTNCRHSNAEDARRVWHGADDGHFRVQSFLNLAGVNRRRHRNEQLAGLDIWPNLLHDFVYDLRFHADKYDIGALDRG